MATTETTMEAPPTEGAATKSKKPKPLKPGNASGNLANGRGRKAVKIHAQELLNELIFRHGSNLPNHADYDAKLASVGLKPGDVTPAMLEIADKEARERSSRTLQWKKPRREVCEGGSFKATVWASECGRYRVARIEGAEPRFAACVKIDAPGAKERLIGTDLRNLDAALRRVEEYHLETTGQVFTDNNSPETLKAAEADGLDRRSKPEGLEKPARKADNADVEFSRGEDSGQDTMTIEEDGTMKISEKKARSLFTALTCGVSDEWKRKELAARLVNITEEVKAAKGNPEGEDLALLTKIVEVTEKGQKVELLARKKKGAPVAATNGQHKTSKEKKVKTSPDRKPSGEVDRFGSRKDSNRAKINAVLGAKPLTVEKIAEKAGLPNTFFRKHLKALMESGHVEKVEDGYKLVMAK